MKFVSDIVFLCATEFYVRDVTYMCQRCHLIESQMSLICVRDVTYMRQRCHLYVSAMFEYKQTSFIFRSMIKLLSPSSSSYKYTSRQVYENKLVRLHDKSTNFKHAREQRKHSSCFCVVHHKCMTLYEFDIHLNKHTLARTHARTHARALALITCRWRGMP